MSPAPTDVGDPAGEHRGLIRALGHPLRAQILGVLGERRASPKELADELGAPLGNVSYHVRVLADLKLVRLVKKTPRRGAIEHHYEAVAPAQISGEAWAKVPAIVKQAVVSAALSEIGRAVNAAATRGGFDRRDAHLTRSRLVLDERGFAELAAELARTVERAEQIDSESQERLAGADHEGELGAALVTMLFEQLPGLEAPAGERSHGERSCRRSPRSKRRADPPTGD